MADLATQVTLPTKLPFFTRLLRGTGHNPQFHWHYIISVIMFVAVIATLATKIAMGTVRSLLASVPLPTKPHDGVSRVRELHCCSHVRRVPQHNLALYLRL